MNFLDLCKRAHTESGLSGAGPSTVIGQTGVTARMIRYVEREWRRIQGLHDHWYFMRNQVSVSTVIGQREYDPAVDWLIDDFDLPYTDTFKFTDNTGKLRFIDWNTWTASNYDVASVVQPGKPGAFTWSPQLEIITDRNPDAAYQIQLEYHRAPQSLVMDTDVPIMPARFHDLIVYAAVMRFAKFDKDMELLQTATTDYEEWLSKLENSQLPAIQFAKSRYAS
jgi:hypothetical protein